MKRVLKKYQNLILHNAVLCFLRYDTKGGIQVNDCKVDEMIEFMADKFGNGPEYGTWMEESFNLVHKEIFKGVPYLMYKNGVIQKYDNSITG